MNILCDKPSELKEALGGDIRVEYSPALDIYTKDNSLLKTLKGLYCSSKLDYKNEALINYIKEMAKPADLPQPTCYVCYDYKDFDSFCKKFIDNEEQLRIAYDVETSAAHYLSSKYKLAGFSLANCVDKGCYVILDSIDYHNEDTDKILSRLGDIIKSHNMLVFNIQHEYIATKKCVGVDMEKECKKVDDAYSLALLLKTEGFKADVFKLKLLCNRLLGLDNWAEIIDDYIELAMSIAREEKFDFRAGLTENQKELVIAFKAILSEYGYTDKEICKFILKLQESYENWKDQDMLPYSLIPSRMIAVYGCYDSCYLLALFDYLETWSKELSAKLADSLNKPDIELAYRETISSQIMSAILTLNGIFISEQRDNEVKTKSKVLAEEHYNKLWDINSDLTNKSILKEYTKAKFKDQLRKTYLLPLYLEKLIPEGFKFIKTTPTFYSFECKKTSVDADELIKCENLKPCNKDGDRYKLLQKHLKPYESLENEDMLLDSVVDKFIEDSLEKDGSLSAKVFKPMSGPAELYDILNRNFLYSKFIERVVLYEYNNLPDKLKNDVVTEFLDNNLLFDFDKDVDLYCSVARSIKSTVFDYIKKQYSYKDIYANLLENGLRSFSSPTIAYIYNVYTATGCSVEDPKYAAFNFICQLKICRKYLRINSTFIKGASGGYSSQMKVDNNSINDKFLRLTSTSVTDDKGEPVYDSETSNVVFGKWYANVADTGRWTATVHNVPAGPYCKRRFTSRFPGGVIMAADMSQMEVRELAMVSKCEKLIDTIKDPTIDIHKRTASLAFDVPYDEVSSTQRKQTKEGIFSIVYGREIDSLAQTLFKGDKAAAQRLMDAIFKVYPEVPVYLKNALADAKQHGYLVTRRGAPIYINPYTEGGKDKGEEAFRRNVQNYAIQGGASYICTNTLHNVQKLLDKYNMRTKIICYIHDSIEIDVPPEEIDLAYKVMYSAFNVLSTKLYDVPCKGDIVIGCSMGEELDCKRIEENMYTISGNAADVKDLIQHLRSSYNVDVIEEKEDEEEKINNNLDWVFTPRAEFVWYDKTKGYEATIKLSCK